MRYVIVSRHKATVEFILEQVPEAAGCPVISTATVADVQDKIVIGNIPMGLGAEADAVWAVEFDGAPPRGQEYGLAEMHAAGA